MNKYTLLVLSLLLVSCTRIVRLNETSSAYTDVTYRPRYATGFTVKSLPGDSTMRMLEVYRPDTMRIVIPRGGFGSFLCMSSTYVGALTEIGEGDKIVAVSNRDYLTDEAVKARTVDVGYDGAMDYEAVLGAKPEVALIYGIGGKSPIEPKLEELSLPYIYINDFEEQNPLGRAEWMVALGVLAGNDCRIKFNKIASDYHPVEDSVPVMINAPYGGVWFIPAKDNYMSKLIADAGARISVAQANGVESFSIDIEEALPALSGARLWLNPGQAKSMADVRRMVPKVRFSGAVWNQTPEFYESGAIRPDRVVKELQSIVGGEAPDSLRYFVRLR